MNEIQDGRLQPELAAAAAWFEKEMAVWLSDISPEDWQVLQNDAMGQDVACIMAYAFRLYGHTLEKTAKMAGIIRLLRCSGNLQNLIKDESTQGGVNRSVQYRLLVGDQLMARALQLLTEEQEFSLVSYFARLVVRMSEGEAQKKIQGKLDEKILACTHASWYEAAFYSAAYLADVPEPERVGALGRSLGMKREAIREGIALSIPLEEQDWTILPEGWQKEALMAL